MHTGTGTLDPDAYAARLQADNAAGRCFFGSMQGVAHVHWHVAPLPPGVPFREQQFAAVDKAEYLKIPRAELEKLALRIGTEMRALAAPEP